MSGVSTQFDMVTSALESPRVVWVVAAMSFFLFLIGNFPWQLDDYDQAKQAFTSLEMIKEGHWFYQQTPHERVATKPPLVGWISAGLFAVTKSWELAWRLPSLLAAIALAILLFRGASSVYGPMAGLVALGAFGLNLLSPRLATLVRTDMPLTLAVFLIGLVIWQKIQREDAWTPRDRVYLFALLTASMLIKGPIVYAFLLPGILMFESWHRRHHSDGRSRSWSGWWPWIASLVVFLLWVAGGLLFQPGFFDGVVMREFLGRFGETVHRPQPIYFYLPHLLHKFAPWSILLIAIAIFNLASRQWRMSAALREMQPGTVWLLCWSIGGLIVMSLIPSKRVDRIFPIIPPLCLLLASQVANRKPCSRDSATCPLTNVDSGPTGLRPVATVDAATRFSQYIMAALVFAIFFTGGYTIWKVVTGYRDRRDALATFARDVRRQVEMHHWRYEVVSTNDEGVLLYLQKTRYISPDNAVAEWNKGNLDALVASREKAAVIMPQLRSDTFYQWKSGDSTKGRGKSYVFIVRRNA